MAKWGENHKIETQSLEPEYTPYKYVPLAAAKPNKQMNGTESLRR
jgi:hypothetical protein